MNALSLPGTRVLVTGANGFIGGHVCEHLVAAGASVRGLVRDPSRAAWLAAQGVSLVQGDLLDADRAAYALRNIDLLVHTAAWTGTPDDPALGEVVNVRGTQMLLDAARSAGVRRAVVFSSVAVYGVNSAPLIDESAATPLVGQAYPDSKIRAEAVAREMAAQGLEMVILRPASTYGPRGTAWTIGPLAQIKAGRLRLLAGGRGLVNTGYIDNVVAGTLLALTQPSAAGQTYNLCDGVAIPFRAFYGYYAAMLGNHALPSAPAWAGRLAVSQPGRWVRRLLGRPAAGPWSLHYLLNPSRFTIDKARRELGYEPTVSLPEGMRRTADWLAAAGYLTNT